MGRFCALVLLLCAAWTPSEAKIKLPAIVGDNMVLQQSCNVKVWGWAAPEAEVSVAPSWCGAVRTQADKKVRDGRNPGRLVRAAQHRPRRR